MMRRQCLVIGVVLLGACMAIAGCGSSSKTSDKTANSVQGSGTPTTETRSVHNFNSVDLTLPATLTVTQGDTESLTVTGPANVLSNITTNVTNGRLLIGSKSGSSIHPNSQVSFKLTAQTLKALNLEGVGTINATKINTPSLAVSLQGAGKITAAGQADEQNVTIDGTGAYDGSQLTTATATTSVNGVGHMTVNVSKTLTAHVNGVGTINYIGDPQVTQHVNGGGAVKKVNG